MQALQAMSDTPASPLFWNQTEWYAGAALALGLAFLSLVVAFIPERPLNVIVISLDSVRADHLEMYGYDRETMPNLTAWANDGAFIFTNYFATSYLTPISETSVQTGRYPFNAGVVNFAAEARPTIPFLVELLKERGYETAAFGSSPEYAINAALAKSFSRGFDHYEPYATSTPTVDANGRRLHSARTSTASISSAITWLQSRNGNTPFYLWLPLGTAHAPYNEGKPLHFTDPSYRGLLAGVSFDEFNWLYGYLYKGTRYATSTMQSPPALGTLTADDLRFVHDRYDDGLYLSDQMLGTLFSYLKQSGLSNNTVVVFESEHGETLGERGYIAHYDIYDETLHTPLIMRIPGLLGSRVSALTSGVDVMPTILSALHVPAIETDGINYLPFMQGVTTTSPRSDVLIARTPLWERVTLLFPEFNAIDDQKHFYDTAIRSTKWKLIHRVSRAAQAAYGWWGMLTGVPQVSPEYELYDLPADSGETTNVYSAHANDSEVSALRLKLTAYEASIQAHMPGPTHSVVQPYF